MALRWPRARTRNPRPIRRRSDLHAYAPLLLFFVSGAAALVFEVATMKALTAAVGSSTLASTATIGVYMAGLACGARWLGQRADRHPQPMRLYATLELGVAATGLLVPLATAALAAGLVPVPGPLRASPAGFLLVRGLVAFGALLPATLLMGGSLPVMVRVVEGEAGPRAPSVSDLYAANTLGAAGGALSAGFLLLPGLGVRGTLGIALALYALVGGGAWHLARRSPAPSEAESAGDPGAPLASDDAPPAWPEASLEEALPVGTAAALLAGTGFVLLALEHAWFRYFAILLGSSTYSFSILLAGVIAGLGVGSLMAGAAARRAPPTRRVLPLALAAYALAVLAPLPFYDDLGYLVWATWLQVGGGWATLTGLKALAGLAVTGIPATISGYLFPTTLTLLLRGPGRSGEQTGLVTAANTLGGLLGITASAFWLVPSLGLRETIEASAAVLLGMAAALAYGSSPGRSLRAAMALAFVLTAVYGAMRSPWVWPRIGGGAFRTIRPGQDLDLIDYWRTQEEQARTVTFLEHGREATVSVDRGRPSELILRVNGKPDASSLGDRTTQNLLAHLPLLLHPSPEEVMIVGLGCGMTAGAATLHEPRHVDVCEIEPAVVRAARLFRHWNHRVLENPDVTVHPEDARIFLMRTDRRYDVIISEPSNPWVAGVAQLFTVETFRSLREHLRSGGVVLQWFHLYETDSRTTASLIRSFQEVFPGASLWVLAHGDVALISGRDGPVAPDLARLATRMAKPGIAEDLRDALVPGPAPFLAMNLLGPETLGGWPEGTSAPRNTDDLPFIEFAAPRAFVASSEVPPPPRARDSLFHTLPPELLDAQARSEVTSFDAAARVPPGSR